MIQRDNLGFSGTMGKRETAIAAPESPLLGLELSRKLIRVITGTEQYCFELALIFPYNTISGAWDRKWIRGKGSRRSPAWYAIKKIQLIRSDKVSAYEHNRDFQP
jgi:hypothetical protein